METVEDGAPEFGKAKLLTRELPESMTADEFQVILGKEMTLAGCAKSRKTPVFVKKNASGLSSKPAEKVYYPSISLNSQWGNNIEAVAEYI